MLDYESLIPSKFSPEDKYNLLEILKNHDRLYKQEIEEDDSFLSIKNKIISDIIFWYVNLFPCKQLVKVFPVCTPVSISPYTKDTFVIQTYKSDHFIDVDSKILLNIKKNIKPENILYKEETLIFDYIRNLNINKKDFKIYFPLSYADVEAFKLKCGDFDVDYFRDMINLNKSSNFEINTLPLNADEILIQYVKPEPAVIFYPYLYLFSKIVKNEQLEFKHLCRYHIEITKWFDGTFELIKLKK